MHAADNISTDISSGTKLALSYTTVLLTFQPFTKKPLEALNMKTVPSKESSGTSGKGLSFSGLLQAAPAPGGKEGLSRDKGRREGGPQLNSEQ